MIDIHCHILPGIDDGAKDIAESIAILKKAETAGVTDLILTPHYIKGTKYNADNTKKWELLQKLTKVAKKEGLKINLYLGNEIYIDEDLPEMLTDEDGEKKYELATLNSKKYVLIELPVQHEDLTAPNTLFELIRSGLVPVIAHPERYEYIQRNLKYAEELVRIGCVLQGDYLALTGKYGKAPKKALKRLLKKDLIFCLASDTHHERDEYQLDVTQKKLQKLLHDQEKSKGLLINHPRQILQGK